MENDIAAEDLSDPNACNSLEFRCNDGECVGKGLVCDGEKHCPDGSDENKHMCHEVRIFTKFSKIKQSPLQCILSTLLLRLTNRD